jgi:protein required for attachment to host cells
MRRRPPLVIVGVTTWVVVADASRARILEIPRRRRRELRELQDFVNPAARAHSRDLLADAHGRYYPKGGRGQPAHAAEPGTDPVGHEVELFAKRVADVLEKARIELRYGELCLIAPPQFLGLLRENLSKETLKLVRKEIPKDLSRLDAAEIRAYVRRGPM